MTFYQLLLVVLLVAFVLLSLIGGRGKSLTLIGYGLACLGTYLLCQLVHSL